MDEEEGMLAGWGGTADCWIADGVGEWRLPPEVWKGQGADAEGEWSLPSTALTDQEAPAPPPPPVGPAQFDSTVLGTAGRSAKQFQVQLTVATSLPHVS